MNLGNIKLMDCTIRDGGYINEWDFSIDFVTSLYQSASEAGIDYVELGFYYGESKDNKSPWSTYQDAVYRKVRAANPNGAAIACLLNYGGFQVSEIPPASETCFDMLRVVCHQADAAKATAAAAELSQKGYQTTVNYMAISNYTPTQLFELVHIINGHKGNVDYFYVADSFGSLMPKQTRRIIDTLKYGTSAPLGFHPHNNLQMAFANSLQAIEAGVDIVDGSVLGMGRGAGNLFTEVMLAYLESEGEKRYRLLPILQFADLFMEPLREHYDWGVSPSQMISGMLGCHPNYPTNLLAGKMHTADDIYHMLKALPESRRGRFNKTHMSEARQAFFENKLKNKSSISSKIHQAAHGRSSVLLLCGGASLHKNHQELEKLVAENKSYVVSVNNPQTPIQGDAVFFGNQRRLFQHKSKIAVNQSVVVGPTINEKAERCLLADDISRVALNSCIDMGFLGVIPRNSGIMALLACVEMGFKTIYIAGMDGFVANQNNYHYAEKDRVDDPMTMQEADTALHEEWNILKKHLKDQGIKVQFVTPSLLENNNHKGDLS